MGEIASFADLLKQYRAAAGLTQEELAERAGLSTRAISDLERGIKQRPYPHTVRQLVQALALDEAKASSFRAVAGGVGEIATRLGESAEAGSDRTVLPIQPTSFIGRQQEVEEISALLSRDTVRLLTLTGPGGVGKTRLALHIAEEVASHFSDGVVFVSLASLADPGLVPATIVAALGVKEAVGQPILETLLEPLLRKRVLLVLDNFEHLLAAGEVVSYLLASCPQLKLLVTSRAVLHLAAEHEYPVPPLGVPVSGHLPELSALSRYDGIQLFVQRAEAIKPGFKMSEENASAIAEICCRLDGLPLAIELAAARIRLFAPQALLDRLSDRLQLLTGGPTDAPARQQTLRSTVDWSYCLLTSQEQRLFARLAVFVGGYAFGAVKAVCAVEGARDLLEGMTSLVEQSLVRQQEPQADTAGEPRFVMLETLREYGNEKLAARGEAADVRQRHADYFLALAERAEPAMWGGPEQRVWLAQLDADHDNLRAALEWFLQQGQVDQELRLAGALERFWQRRSHFSEGRRWLEAGLARAEEVSLPARVIGLRAAGSIALIQGDEARTVALMEELLQLAREQADWAHVRSALILLGVTAYERGDYRQATQHYEECLTNARAEGSPDLANALLGLGLTKSEEGRFAEGIALIEEARALFRTRGDLFWETVAFGSLAYISLLEGKWRQAQPLLVGYLGRAQQLHDKLSIAASLEGLAVLAVKERRAEHATRLLAAAIAVREETGGRLLSPRNRALIKEATDSAREQLGEVAWLTAWEEGRATSLDEAVAYALEEND